MHNVRADREEGEKRATGKKRHGFVRDTRRNIGSRSRSGYDARLFSLAMSASICNRDNDLSLVVFPRPRMYLP